MHIAVCVLTAAAAAGPSAAPCRTEVVAPAEGAAADAFVAWARVNDWGGRHRMGEDGFRGDVRLVDLDNDGAEEVLASVVEGSGGYLDLWVLRPAGDGYVPVRLPESFAYDHPYFDREAGGSRLVERLCGRTYLNIVTGDATALAKTSYVWEGGTIRRACDDDWLREQRRQFQERFARGQYRGARPLLEGSAACAGTADPELWLWLQSDAARAAHRMRTYDECLDLVEGARKAPAFSRGSAEVRAALGRTRAACAEAKRRRRSHAGRDFAWMLELERDPSRQFVLDERFEDVLTALVPDHTVEGRRLRDQARLDLYLPGASRFEGGRYVVLTGCRPHDCGSKAMVWVDVASRRGLVYARGLLASTTIAPGEVPPRLWTDLREMIGVSPLDEGAETIPFVDARGGRTLVRVPEQD